jgi:hypothetical protein
MIEDIEAHLIDDFEGDNRTSMRSYTVYLIFEVIELISLRKSAKYRITYLGSY